MPITCEQHSETLFISGSVERSQEQNLRSALDSYGQNSDSDSRVVDLSHVRFLTTSAARTLIEFAQENNGNGDSSKLKVLASLPVMQTLNLLGAKTWLEITSCNKPNPIPSAGGTSTTNEKTPEPEPEPKEEEPKEVQPDPAPPPPKSPPKPAGSTGIMPRGASTIPRGKGTSGISTRKRGAELPPGSYLADEDEDLPPNLIILKRLAVGQTYSFHFATGEMTGSITEYLGGGWVKVNARGGEKYVNLTQLQWVDLL